MMGLHLCIFYLGSRRGVGVMRRSAEQLTQGVSFNSQFLRRCLARYMEVGWRATVHVHVGMGREDLRREEFIEPGFSIEADYSSTRLTVTVVV